MNNQCSAYNICQNVKLGSLICFVLVRILFEFPDDGCETDGDRDKSSDRGFD